MYSFSVLLKLHALLAVVAVSMAAEEEAVEEEIDDQLVVPGYLVKLIAGKLQNWASADSVKNKLMHRSSYADKQFSNVTDIPAKLSGLRIVRARIDDDAYPSKILVDILGIAENYKLLETGEFYLNGPFMLRFWANFFKVAEDDTIRIETQFDTMVSYEDPESDILNLGLGSSKIVKDLRPVVKDFVVRAMDKIELSHNQAFTLTKFRARLSTLAINVGDVSFLFVDEVPEEKEPEPDSEDFS